MDNSYYVIDLDLADSNTPSQTYSLSLPKQLSKAFKGWVRQQFGE